MCQLSGVYKTDDGTGHQSDTINGICKTTTVPTFSGNNGYLVPNVGGKFLKI